MRLLAVVVAAAVTFSTIPAASPEAATLRTGGIVVVNSVPMLDGATVRTGDVIRTGADGLAIVLSPVHGRSEVRADSEARLRAGGIELLRGAVASSRLPVAAGGFTFRTAASSGAWFAVARRNGRLVAAAYRGALWIAAPGQSPVVVSEGSYAEKESDQDASAPASPPARRPSTKRRKGAKAAAGSAASGGWTIGSLSHGASVALVVGVGAGVAAAAAGFARGLNEPGPSPND